ncbi:hypothetical protein SAMN02745912_03726 [Paramaledivibacter caminithermalis DSM 15212]|uniref:Uncharacterized protein n=1 Tax=Paramaledivibacter caminithermalis (strain DSM 15212 / CIP 107654 / DViRD3) TaxID=1121301 RepID=A0A1M6TLV7_PARC5|nr:hypothetical protein SAMN02745912_03726 [Paramaledivibacter caminithermalis DSM 15212]
MTVGRTEHKKHLHNLMKTVEGTGWILFYMPVNHYPTTTIPNMQFGK